MKLSFTTLGCPKWDLDTILSRAAEYGFDAIDFRGYLGQIKLYELDEFTKDAGKTAEKIKKAGIEVSCVSSSARAYCPDSAVRAEFAKELAAYGRLCNIFGTRYVRIFGGGIGDTPRARALKEAVGHLKQIVKIAEDHDIVILVETHDDWTAAEDLRRLVEGAESPRVEVLWDVHHPYRMKGESPSHTWNVLGKYVRNTHWKDSCPDTSSKHGYKLCLCGQGDIPYGEILGTLRGGGYDGWLTLEWEKMWHPEIEDAELALPNFVSTMRRLGA